MDLVKEIQYPYITYINPEQVSSGIKGLTEKIIRRIRGSEFLVKMKLKGVNHIFEGSDQYPFIKNQYYWVHDFQEFRLPDFFSKEDAEKRSALPRRIAGMTNATLILSSYDAFNDFKTFFPGYKCKVKVWRFTSSLPDFSNLNFEAEREKLKITRPYFICSNQFWQHKNHRTILEAIKLLKEKNLFFEVVFTGKNFDHRNPGYFNGLESFIAEHGLQTWTNFVGFIDRKLQLSLAKNAVSYIQPSFFEGWSTTVEDAKYLNQFVLLSDIPVHREQMDYNVLFFNPSDAKSLAAAMEKVIVNRPEKENRDYKKNIIAYGKEVLNTFRD